MHVCTEKNAEEARIHQPSTPSRSSSTTTTTSGSPAAARHPIRSRSPGSTCRPHDWALCWRLLSKRPVVILPRLFPLTHYACSKFTSLPALKVPTNGRAGGPAPHCHGFGYNQQPQTLQQQPSIQYSIVCTYIHTCIK
jgi:hypothetical protein